MNLAQKGAVAFSEYRSKQSATQPFLLSSRNAPPHREEEALRDDTKNGCVANMKLKQARLKNMRGLQNIRIRVNIAHEYAVRNSKGIPLRKGWFQNEVSLRYQGLDLVYTLIPLSLLPRPPGNVVIRWLSLKIIYVF